MVEGGEVYKYMGWKANMDLYCPMLQILYAVQHSNIILKKQKQKNTITVMQYT